VEENPKVRKEICTNIKRLWNKMTEEEKTKYDPHKDFLEATIYDYYKKNACINFNKGLECILLGIIVSNPTKNFDNVKKIFLYLMEVEKVRDIFGPATPLFFSELEHLLKEIKGCSSELEKRLTDAECNWNLLFVSYYRTLLLNRIKD
jgi:hypothetical protein